MFYRDREDWEMKPSERTEKEIEMLRYRKAMEKNLSYGTPFPTKNAPLMPMVLALVVFFIAVSAVRFGKNSVENKSALVKDWEIEDGREKGSVSVGNLQISSKALIPSEKLYLIEAEFPDKKKEIFVVNRDFYEKCSVGDIVPESLLNAKREIIQASPERKR